MAIYDEKLNDGFKTMIKLYDALNLLDIILKIYENNPYNTFLFLKFYFLNNNIN